MCILAEEEGGGILLYWENSKVETEEFLNEIVIFEIPE